MAQSIGLRLNHAKCEVIGLSPVQEPIWDTSGLRFLKRPASDATLLGSPLSLAGTSEALRQSCDQLERVSKHLLKLPAHEAFFLLKNSLAIPRLQYLLRTAPCCLCPESVLLDEEVRRTLSSVLNLKLDDVSWAQASLPVRWGGIGVRKASVLAPSAFLASAHAATPLAAVLLPGDRHLPSDRLFLEAAARWSTLSRSPFPQVQAAFSQRALDDGVSSAISRDLLLQADPVNRARLLTSLALGSGAWLQAIPSSNLGLRLGNNELRVAVGLRLGVPLVRPHRCVCGSEGDSSGHHGLACRRSAGRHRRHTLANDVLVRAVRAVEVHAELEPPRLLRGDGKRPDGATLDPWSGGRYLVWDFTCPDTHTSAVTLETILSGGWVSSGSRGVPERGKVCRDSLVREFHLCSHRDRNSGSLGRVCHGYLRRDWETSSSTLRRSKSLCIPEAEIKPSGAEG